jgi:hypothetical protein
LTPSTYDEAKNTITNDAYLNGKRFAGESEDEDTKTTNNGRTNPGRNRSKRQSRSGSRGKGYFRLLFIRFFLF